MTVRNLSVGDIVKGTTAKFIYYRDGELWYEVKAQPEGTAPFTFKFPVPVQEEEIDPVTLRKVKKIVVAEFGAEMKAITLMRWIRKYLDAQKEWATT